MLYNFKNNSNFANHILRRLNPDELNIIMCNAKFEILDISSGALKLFDVKEGDNLADFIDYNVCQGFKKVILEKNSTVLTDKIDDVFFEIDAEEYNGNAVLFFAEINANKSISNIAKATSNILNQYILINDNLMKNIQIDENLAVFQEERRQMHKLFDFNTKIELFIEDDTINIPGFQTLNFSDFLMVFIEKVRKTVENTNIQTEIANALICEFCYDKFTIALVNAFSNIFTNSSTDTLINVKLYEKNDNIHLSISAKCDIESNSKNHEITAIRRVLVLHKGNVFIKKSNDIVELYLSFPIRQSSDDFFESSALYESQNLKSDRLIKTLELYNDFKN